MLEIGCGDGYLLSRLQQRGAHVVGVEPGEHGQDGSRHYGVAIVRSSFPTETAATAGPFDLILHYAVMEHLTDPDAFLRAQAPRLATTGKIVFAVPDCSAYVAHGDVGMFAHEHWSYFTPQSLRALVEQVGLRLAHVERSGFGGALYAVADARGAAAAGAESNWDVQDFAARVRRGIDGARAFFATALRPGRSVGVFAPGRFINYLHLAQPAQLPRLFDDEPNLHGKYYPPFDQVVESRAALLAEPVDELIIASRSFGERLRNELSQEGALRETRISLLDEVLSCASSGAAL
ncbi:MAG: class I SAM-dependent methyltransferase [Chloroflexi bacterium]|nr:class I SAM-dependent methyltransferase [Chloroflexota bacterium]